MRNLEEIYGRCVKDRTTGCMIYKGHCNKDGPRIFAPDPITGKMSTYSGRRAVWQLAHKKQMPHGYLAFSTCGNQLCVNLKHIACRTYAEHGRDIVESGRQKGLVSKIIANRVIAKARSKLNDELIAEILSSAETGVQLAKRLGVSNSTISKVRRGQMKVFASPGAGLFTGLMK